MSSESIKNKDSEQEICIMDSKKMADLSNTHGQAGNSSRHFFS